MHSQIKDRGWERIPWGIDSRRDMRPGAVEGWDRGRAKFGGESLVLEKKKEWEREREEEGRPFYTWRVLASLASYSLPWQGLVHVYRKPYFIIFVWGGLYFGFLALCLKPLVLGLKLIKLLHEILQGWCLRGSRLGAFFNDNRVVVFL
jgi:hypothetical protein